MTRQDFWSIIEATWNRAPEWKEKRRQALESNDYALLQQLDGALNSNLLGAYTDQLKQLDQDALTAFIQHLEERIYHIDRAEIQRYTDGSDDGFLYCRCFIVGMGETYYNKIDQQPELAAMDLEAESIGFAAYQVYEERFGEEFERYKHHSMESCSNEAGWEGN